ncbi:MAG TPA: hypothetical protein H9673_05265 [Candidatus Adamsella sp.]|nr:hypothetical protein [Candidatus Adamsella sp.]
MKNFILILCVLFALTSSVFADENKAVQDVEIENSYLTRIKVQKSAEIENQCVKINKCFLMWVTLQEQKQVKEGE